MRRSQRAIQWVPVFANGRTIEPLHHVFNGHMVVVRSNGEEGFRDEGEEEAEVGLGDGVDEKVEVDRVGGVHEKRLGVSGQLQH